FPFALKFLLEGYDGITFDWRAHGRSGGHLVSFGENERFDIQTILQSFSKELSSYDQRVAFGASMGGGNLIKNWDLFEKSGFTKLILDSPYADVRDAVVQKLWFLPVPDSIKWFISNVTCRMASVFINLNSVSNPPIDNLHKLKNSQVLLIHGKEDQLLPYQGSERMYKILGPTVASLVLYERAGHLSSYRKHSKNYEKMLKVFLEDK
ncbi:alpha/beta hydrolase, partial [bacterium]|nr:alpha/beta hydrolase [bacterium]